MWSEKLKTLSSEQRSDGLLPSYAFPGGYPVYYQTEDGDSICPDCANEAKDGEEEMVVDFHINEEDDELRCDICDRLIPSAWGEDDDDETATFDDLEEDE